MVHVVKQALGTLILFFHVIVEYLNVAAIQVRNAQIRVELDAFNMVLSTKCRKPRIHWFKLLKNFISYKDFKTKNFLFLQLRLVRIVRVRAGFQVERTINRKGITWGKTKQVKTDDG